ncbi:MAG: hypothetical protein L6R39_000684 [Caloplaca ligustica]|nr:MAG: hypothetical protein L6R39_000684 [Caloplaca ligustica]
METVASAPTTSNLQQVMEDRRRRLEADKAAKDAAEKSKRKAIAQARREKANAAPGTPVSNQSLYAQEQRKRKQEAREERERILKVIENDKAERKEKEAQRRALAKAEATDTAKEADVGEASESTGPGLVPNWGGTSHPRQCALQVRLFDGTTIRGKFQSDQTLGAAVRTWIAEQRTDGDTPFTLKQILTPLPNRTITISEEEESLQTLGLLPSATMVMVPIQGYIGAYTNDQGIIGKAVSVGYNAASTGGNLLKGALGTVFGFGQAAPNTQGASTDEQHRNNSDKEHQLYNGNQLNFEPRRDKDDDQ